MPWYTIRSHKRQTSLPELPWVNTAEVFAATPIGAEQAQGGMAAWRNFERSLTHDLVEFHDATLSSWLQEPAADSPPDELFQFQGGVETGNRTAPAAPSPLEYTLFINRMPSVGQKGKLFLRGCIEEPQLGLAQRGRYLLPAGISFFQGIVGTSFTTLETALTNFGLKLGMVAYPRVGWEAVPVPPGAKPKYKPIYGTTIYERFVGGMRVRGMSTVQLRQH